MFERYTEKAGRVIFFARYEASRVGSPEIGDEHLLLGLMIEGKDIVRDYLGGESSMAEIRAAIAARVVARKPPPIKVDLPLSPAARQILAYAAEEATRLGHQHIGTAHLLLGILREEKCLSVRLLREHGVTLKGARVQVAEATKDAELGASQGSGSRGAARSSGTHIHLIEVESSEPLLTCYTQASLPQIGEMIAIHAEGKACRRYRVKDVVWNIRHGDSGPHMADVELRIAAEDSNEG